MKMTICLKTVVTLIFRIWQEFPRKQFKSEKCEPIINWVNYSCLTDFKSKMTILSAFFIAT